MIHRFFCFALLIFITIFYVGSDGLPHPRTFNLGSSSWDTGSADWRVVYDKSEDHPTITVYTSCNVSRYLVDEADSSSSDSEPEYEEWGFGYARASAETMTITIGGESKKYKPKGKVHHWASVHFYSPRTPREMYEWIQGHNDIKNVTNYRGDYNESTHAYNRSPNIYSETWFLGARASGSISNPIAEKLQANHEELHRWEERQDTKAHVDTGVNYLRDGVLRFP